MERECGQTCNCSKASEAGVSDTGISLNGVALVIGANDTLVISLPQEMSPDIDEIINVLRPRLDKLGLSDRTLLFAGGVEIGKVESNA